MVLMIDITLAYWRASEASETLLSVENRKL